MRGSRGGTDILTQSEYDSVVAACRRLPPATGTYLEDDYIVNLFVTVLDFMMHVVVVDRALDHYRQNCWDEVRTLDDLEGLFERYPDDREGNTALAAYLWGYKLWTRAELLRGLAAFFRGEGILTQNDLRTWAKRSDFARDFKGRVRGLGYAVYNWLVMRQGVETVKPDTHVHRFVRSVLGRGLSDTEVVELLERVARELGLKAYQLDWRIWEHQRSRPGS